MDVHDARQHFEDGQGSQLLLDRALLTALGRAFGEDATQETLAHYVSKGLAIEDPDRCHVLVVDNGARDSDHALARLRTAIRRRAWRAAASHNAESRRLERFLTADGLATLPSDQPERDVDIQAVRAGLCRLPEAEADDLLSYDGLEQGITAITERRGLTPDAARQRLVRARRRLAACPEVTAIDPRRPA